MPLGMHWWSVKSRGTPIGFFSEKLRDSRRVKYATFKKVLYVLL